MLVRRLLITIALAVSPGLIEAQGDSLLPVDPAVRIGTLPNGLRYFLRANRRPEKRAELRLVVNAGSAQEDDDQRGLAHFVEHMAFNGTRHFEKQKLVDYIESIGMRFGPDLNAYTSFDETVYLLQVPTDSAPILRQAFQILEDWAHGVTFDTAEIRKERGVVLEEWRLGRGAGQRMLDQQLPVLFRGSRYADRLPIGTPDCIRQCPPEAIRRFYDTWYRPELMALVAVGDFDPATIEALVREHFATIPAEPGPRRDPVAVASRRDAEVSVASDPEATGTTISVYLLRPPGPRGTVRAWRADLVENLAAAIVNERLWELTQRPNPPFLAAGAGPTSLVRSTDAFSFGALVPDSGVRRGLEAILTELTRAGRHGFTPGELDRARREHLRAVEQAHAERDKTESESFAGRFVAHFLTGEAVPDIAHEFARAQAEVPRVRLAELDSVARNWLVGGAPVILVNTPEKNRAAVPPPLGLLGLFAEVQQREIPAYTEQVSEEALVPEDIASASIMEERRDSALGTIEWVFANGARVILKPTDFKDDQILFHGFRAGGLSTTADSALTSARFAAQLVSVSGVGKFSAIELQKKLAGKAVSLSPYVGSYEQGVSGQASPKDVETLFQLAYLYFTAPRRDDPAIGAFLGNLRAALANRSASPQAAFQDTLSVTLAQHHPWSRPISSATVDEVRTDQAFAFYRNRFATAQGFTFVIVGTFEPDSLRPLVQRYIGHLPGSDAGDQVRDPGIRPPSRPVERTVAKGIEPKSQTALVFTGPAASVTLPERWILSALGDVLEIRFREELREELGGSYGVSVSPQLNRIPRPQYSVSISFGSDPGMADSLTRVIFAEIDSIQARGPRPGDLAKVKEAALRSRETALRENGWWLQQLMMAARDGDPAAAPLAPLLEGITVESVRDAARKYLDRSRYVRVTLLPEQK
ncbi:MAG: M16 family metallopeptidase [Gemmatimonadales bacterium]